MLSRSVLSFIAGALLGGGIMYDHGQKDLAIAAKDIAEYVADIQTERADHRLAIQKLQNKIGVIDVESTAKIAAIQKENDRLADCLRSGKCGLRLTGKPPAPTGTGAGANNTGLDNGGACELDAGARRHYLALRKGIEKQREQLIAAQKILLLCGGDKQSGKRRNATE